MAAWHRQHFVRWMNEPVPALDGWTPRRAAKDPVMHPKLERLLREIENAEDRKRAAGEDWYDLGWLQAELGVG